MKEFNNMLQVVKDLVLTNKLVLIIAIILSVYFIFRAGNAVGEFIYYLKK
jgi:hypothetical protein